MKVTMPFLLVVPWKFHWLPLEDVTRIVTCAPDTARVLLVTETVTFRPFLLDVMLMLLTHILSSLAVVGSRLKFSVVIAPPVTVADFD